MLSLETPSSALAKAIISAEFSFFKRDNSPADTPSTLPGFFKKSNTEIKRITTEAIKRYRPILIKILAKTKVGNF